MKANRDFYVMMQAFYNPEHIQRSYEAWDAIPDAYKGALEGQDIYRENYYLSFDKNNPDRRKNAPADSLAFQAEMAERAAQNADVLENFWDELEMDQPWGGHERISGDIHRKFGEVTYISEDDLPEIFRQTFGGVGVRSHYATDGYFYAYDEAGRPFKQKTTMRDL